jgi:hypothetical protein
MFRTLLLSVLSVSSVVSHADDGWTLTTSDFKRQPANLRSLDDSGAKIIPLGATTESTIPLDKLLQLDRGAAAVQQVRGTWTLHLATGDRVGGDPVSIANDQLTWRSPAAGELALPVTHLRGITRGNDTTAPTFDPNRTEDAVFLSNGDNVRGIVTGIEAGKINVKQASGDVLPVDLSAAKAVHFAAAQAPAPTGRAFRVQLADGSVVTAPRLDLKDNKLSLTFNEAGPARPVDLAQVVLIEQLNGPVAWLSARTPKETVYQPMFDVSFPPQTDRNYRGDRIKFQGREYARGIGVHAYCKLTYALTDEQGAAAGGAGFKAFRTQYALSDDAYKGKVTVRILLDDKVVHEARDLPPGKLSPVIVLDLGSAKTLTLEAHPGGDPTTDDRTKWHTDTQARLNWIEPALLKEKPAPEPPKPAPTPTEPPKSETPATDPPKTDTPTPDADTPK